ncbi:MAG: Gx transporter family protein [Oscillospiraceae bacterium]|nr:Gx transporter family protein [Oscillospiraceae bacterium]MDD3832613.1 Gx transporter family protein [Oscillospiraceae bacterium]MDD4546723.1 Gx transporter family protein [Oscillospiraceae bacterium]
MNAEISQKIKRLVLTGMLFATAIVLSVVEDLIQLPLVAPGVKLGLANIVVMYTLFFLGGRTALLVSVLKSYFVFITRGLVASILSLCGGLLSIVIMLLLLKIFKDRVSYLVLSISGSICHNLGQLIVVSLIYSGLIWIVHLPILLISGVLAGTATATLLKVFLPAFKKLDLK